MIGSVVVELLTTEQGRIARKTYKYLLFKSSSLLSWLKHVTHYIHEATPVSQSSTEPPLISKA